MGKSRFTGAQIIGMLKEQEAGLSAPSLCRKHGLGPATWSCRLKARHGRMDLSGVGRLKQLVDGSAKLERLLADTAPDNMALKDLPGSKPWGASGPRTMTDA